MFSKMSKVTVVLTVLITALSTASCVTETVESPGSMKFSQASVIAVQDPNAHIKRGSTFAWLPEAVQFYEDKRLEGAPVKSLIEQEIVRNLKAQEMQLVESANGSSYSIAYTAALESAMDDAAIIRRFGLVPGNSQIPTDDVNVEKGTLIIYVFNNRTHDVIWRSASQVGVSFNMAEQDRKERVEQVLGEMFMTFPVDKSAEQ